MITAEEAANRIGGPVQSTGSGLLVCCPAHGDSTPSLSLSNGSDGKLLWHCHAGCSQQTVHAALKSLGLTAASVFTVEPDINAYCADLYAYYGLSAEDFASAGCGYKADFYFGALATKSPNRIPAFIYPVLMPDGRVLNKYKSVYRVEQDRSPALQIVTYGCGLGKRVMQSDKGAKGVFPGTYVKGDGPLVVTGGEEKAMALIKSGYRAVSLSHGEKGMSAEIASMLVNYGNTDCVVVMDNDEAGFGATRHAASLLTEAGATVRCVVWDAILSASYDVNDAFRDGGVARVQSIINAAVPAAEFPAEQKPKACDVADLVAENFQIFTSSDILNNPDIKPVEWLVPGILPEGLTLLASDPKAGKTVMAYQMAYAIATGGEFFGQKANQAGVLVLNYEMHAGLVKEYIGKVCPNAPPNLRFALFPRFSFCPAHEPVMEHLLSTMPDVKLVIVDTLQHAIMKKPSTSKNAYEMDVEAHSFIRRLANKTGVSFLLIHHTNKSRDSSGFGKISGSNGIRSSYDTNFYLEKPLESNSAKLHIEGRSNYVASSLAIKRSGNIWVMEQ